MDIDKLRKRLEVIESYTKKVNSDPVFHNKPVFDLLSIAKVALAELDKANERIDDLEGDVAGLTDGQNQVEADLEQRLDAALEQLATVNQSYADAAEAWRNNAVELTRERDAALADLESTELGLRKTTERYSEVRAEVKRLKERQLEALDDCLCALGTIAGDYYDGYREAVSDMRRAFFNPDTPEVDHE